MSKENGKRGVISHIFWILVLLAFIGGCIFLAPYVMDVFGIKQEDRAIDFEIYRNDNTASIASRLEEKGVILNSRIYIKQLDKELEKQENSSISYNPGIYEINSNMSHAKLLSVFQDEPKVDRSVVKVVFPEGKRVYEMAEILEENGICKADDFIRSQNEDEFDYDFVKEIENKEERGYRLEGYLFPATYDFQKNTDAKDVVNEMLAAFADRITPSMKSRMTELNVSLDDIITLASIIQAEATNDETIIKNVSAVFNNRLKSDDLPRLESDPTIKYADLLVEKKILTEEQAIKYDTYESEGLPPGPQNNPGVNMIEGALWPAEVDYTYFVTDLRDGKFYYASTYYEHQENCRNANVTVPY